MLTGKNPLRDWNRHNWIPGTDDARNAGQPVCGPFFFVVWQFRGDMEYFTNYLFLEHFGSLFCCPWCQANVFDDDDDVRCALWDVVARPWNDFGRNPRWLESCWGSMDEWLACHGGIEKVHPIFMLLGVTIFTIMADSLHIMELGVVHRVIGNVLFHVAFTPELIVGASPTMRLEALWRRILTRYSELRTPSQLGNLTMAMFCNETSPAASQPVLSTRVKAAESRYLVAILADLFPTLARPGNLIDAHIEALLNSIKEYYVCLECTAPILPIRTQQLLEAAVWSMVRHCNALQIWALREGLNRWSMTIKHHYAVHIALQSRYANPRMSWTYVDEDFMSLLKEIGDGTPPHMVVNKTCEKYVLGMDLRASLE